MLAESVSEALVAEVQKRPALYDRSDINYSNRTYVNNQWRDIAKLVGIEDEITARKKWTSLRDYFQKHHRQMTTFDEKSGQAIRKKWYLYEAMQFVLPFLSERKLMHPCTAKTPEDDQESNDIPYEEDDVLSDSSFTPSSQEASTSVQDPTDFRQLSVGAETRSAKKRKMSLHCHPDADGPSPPSTFEAQLIETLKHWDRKSGIEEKLTESKKTEDEDELFFRSLLPKLKLLDPISKMECLGEIHMTVLRYLKLCTQRPDQIQEATVSNDVKFIV